jgi:hypothetical protein
MEGASSVQTRSEMEMVFINPLPTFGVGLDFASGINKFNDQGAFRADDLLSSMPRDRQPPQSRRRLREKGRVSQESSLDSRPAPVSAS